MHWQYLLPYLVDHYIAVDFIGGGGISGKLCRYDLDGIHLVIYEYPQFITRSWMYSQVRDIKPFPGCNPVPTPY